MLNPGNRAFGMNRGKINPVKRIKHLIEKITLSGWIIIFSCIFMIYFKITSSKNDNKFLNQDGIDTRYDYVYPRESYDQ